MFGFEHKTHETHRDGASHSSPALPRQYEASSVDDTMWATSLGTRGGVTDCVHGSQVLQTGLKFAKYSNYQKLFHGILWLSEFSVPKVADSIRVKGAQ